MSIPTSTFNAMGFSRYGRGQAASYVRRCLGGNFDSACIQNDLGASPASIPTQTLTLSHSGKTVLSSTSVANDWFSVIASGLDPIELALDPNHSWTVQTTMPVSTRDTFWQPQNTAKAEFRILVTAPDGATAASGELAVRLDVSDASATPVLVFSVDANPGASNAAENTYTFDFQAKYTDVTSATLNGTAQAFAVVKSVVF